MPESNPDPKTPSSAKKGAFQISSEPLVSGDDESVSYEVHKFEIGSTSKPAPVAAPVYEDLASLPESYFEDTLFLAARDPRWLFSYWDFNWGKYSADAFRGGVKQFFLKIYTAAGAD